MEKGTAHGKVPFRESRKRSGTWFAVSIALVAALFFFACQGSASKDSQAGASGPVLAAPRSYVGRVEHATTIQPGLAGDKATISLAEVDKLNIVDFEWKDQKGDPVPVMAYITSSGRLFIGHSLCGCGGTEFFLAGETLVCSSCRTTFTIEDQKFMSGSTTAGKKPPARIKSVVEDGMIVIGQSDLED